MLKNSNKNIIKERVNTKFKLNDEVIVIAGDSKGVKGKIIKIDFKENKVMVEGANIIKKTQKRKSEQDKGGIIEKEAFIHFSNIAMLDKNGKKTKIKYKTIDGNKSRVTSKGEVI